jgi:hypothetical protein
MTTAAEEVRDPTVVDPTVEAVQDPMGHQNPMGLQLLTGPAEDPGPIDMSNGGARTLNA